MKPETLLSIANRSFAGWIVDITMLPTHFVYRVSIARGHIISIILIDPDTSKRDFIRYMKRMVKRVKRYR